MERLEPLISVIIPVYNCAKYIARCIDSLLEQTYENIEIIIVDDGSTDNSASICHEYNEKKLTYFYQKNAGPSAARNKGLEMMNGEYVTFVDADDYVAPGYIRSLYELICKYNVKIAVCSYIKKNNLQKDFDIRKKPLDERELLSEEALKSLFYKKEISTNTFNKLYHISIVQKQKYLIHLHLGEDLQFIYEALKKVNKIAYSNKELYYYCQNEKSITHNFKIDMAEAHWEQLKILESENEGKIKEAVISRMFIVAYDFQSMMPNEDINTALSDELINFISANKIKVLFNKENKFITRMLAMGSLISIRMMLWVCKKLKSFMNSGRIVLRKAI